MSTKPYRLFRATAAVVLCAAMLPLGAPGRPTLAADTGVQVRHALVGQTPDAVTRGLARLRGAHDPRAVLTLNIGLGVHNSDALDALIVAAGTPGNPLYGHYLSPAQYAATYAPTTREVDAVRAWATGSGLTVRAVAANNLLVTVQGSTDTVERALGVRVNDYEAQGRAFYANDRDAVVPSGLDIRAISGLSSLHRFYVARTPRVPAMVGPYTPQNFQAAYDMGRVGNGNGNGSDQTIGLTLWGAPLAQSDLDAFAANTNTPRLVAGQSGANGLEWILVDGKSAETDVQVEQALDVEYAHGVAANSHLKYWLANTDPTTCDANGANCQPTDAGLEDAVNAAARDTTLHVVSNSWGGVEATSANDPFISAINASLQMAASHGTTFYFASGDFGYTSGATCASYPGCTTPAPSFPADSPYVVSVGGTNLTTGADGSYASERVWGTTGNGASGGGCSTVFARPTWQTGVSGAATCSGRAVPDVSADADPDTGAYVYAQGTPQQIGGTSLATPLWAGMAADLNRYLGAMGQPPMGFAAPRIYQLAGDATTYGRDFHDVTLGNNDPAYATSKGSSAGPGWDEATGWGSPDLTNLAADWSPSPTTTTTTTTTTTASPSPTTTAVASSVSTATTSPATASSTSTAMATATTGPATVSSTSTASPVTAPATPTSPSGMKASPTAPTATPLAATATATATPVPGGATTTVAGTASAVSVTLSPTSAPTTPATTTPTNIRINTATNTSTNTPTNTPTTTPTNTNTPINTTTATPTNTATNTATPTNTPTNTSTNTPTNTPANTMIALPMPPAASTLPPSPTLSPTTIGALPLAPLLPHPPAAPTVAPPALTPAAHGSPARPPSTAVGAPPCAPPSQPHRSARNHCVPGHGASPMTTIRVLTRAVRRNGRVIIHVNGAPRARLTVTVTIVSATTPRGGLHGRPRPARSLTVARVIADAHGQATVLARLSPAIGNGVATVTVTVTVKTLRQVFAHSARIVVSPRASTT